MSLEQKTWTARPVRGNDQQARYVLMCRETSRISVALGLYESHLVSGAVAHNTRRNRLMDCAYLYSWAQEVGIDVDRRFLMGVGLEAREVRRFAHWLKHAYIGRDECPLKSATVATILNSCARVSRYMYEQYLEVAVTSGRVEVLATVLSASDGIWASVTPDAGVDAPEAPDLTDEEMARIETVMYPDVRTDIPQEMAVRDYLLWRLTSRLGLRIGEVLALRLVDCPVRPGAPLRIERIEHRGKAYFDPRTPYAPRPKTLSRDLNLAEDAALPELLAQYVGLSRSHRGMGDQDPSCGFLILSCGTGRPLSTSAAQQVAERISEVSGVEFHWHVARHCYFNREFAKIADLPNYAALKDILQYKGGWRNPESLKIYTRRILRERAFGAHARYQQRLGRMGHAVEREYDDT